MSFDTLGTYVPSFLNNKLNKTIKLKLNRTINKHYNDC